MKISSLKAALALSLIFNITVLGTIGYLRFSKRCDLSANTVQKISDSKHLFERLSLKPEQTAQFLVEAAAFHKELDARHHEIAIRRDQLFRLMGNAVTDERQIRVAVRELSQKQEEVEWLVARHILQLKSGMTREQQQEFMGLIERSLRSDKRGSGPAPCLQTR